MGAKPIKLWISKTQGGKEITKSRVYTWGAANLGQLGLTLKISHGTKNHIVTPTVLKDIKNITKISVFADYSLCLHESGQVYGFG